MACFDTFSGCFLKLFISRYSFICRETNSKPNSKRSHWFHRYNYFTGALLKEELEREEEKHGQHTTGQAKETEESHLSKVGADLEEARQDLNHANQELNLVLQERTRLEREYQVGMPKLNHSRSFVSFSLCFNFPPKPCKLQSCCALLS